jgi:uncharacterized membrane protein
MDDIDHTNPHTGEAFGANGGVFTRGPAAADGGTEDDEMREVDHVAPDGDGASEVWERGPANDHASEDDEQGTDEVKPAEGVPETNTDE